MSLRVRREVSNKQKEEALLLEKINRGLSLKQVERFKILDQKRFNEVLTNEEYEELSVLVEKIENLNVRRLKYLIALAKLRNVTVKKLVEQLNLSLNNG